MGCATSSEAGRPGESGAEAGEPPEVPPASYIKERNTASELLSAMSDMKQGRERYSEIEVRSMATELTQEASGSGEGGDGAAAPEPGVELMGTATLDADAMEALHAAATAPDPVSLRRLLEEHPSAVNVSPWRDSGSLLHAVAELGHANAADALVHATRPALVSHVDEDGQTPLHVAAANGALEVARVLTQASRRRGGCAELTKLDTYKMTPLHLACEAGDEEMVRHILAELGRQERGSYIVELRRGSANFLARKNNHTGVVSLLEKAGAEPDIP